MDDEVPLTGGFARSAAVVAWVAMIPEHMPSAADPSPEADDSNAGPDRGSASGTPRWVSVLGIIIAIVLVVLVVLAHLTGTIGPGLH